MRTKISLLLTALAVFALPALAQEGNSEVSASVTGNFQNQATGTGLTDTPTYSAGFLVNYRYHFNRWSAVEVNHGFSRFSQEYDSGNFTQSNNHEATFAYVFTFGTPPEARFHPFLETGTGVLFFSPVGAGSTIGSLGQDRATFLYGGGVDYKLTKRLGIRAGYRGLIYRAPDFTVSNQFTNAVTQMAEPYVGVTFRF